MIPENDFLRVRLTFLDDLDEIAAIVEPTRGPNCHPGRPAGIIKGHEQLQNFLEKIGIDSILCWVDDRTGLESRPTINDISPNSLVAKLRTRIESVHAVLVKILNGEKISDSEKSLRVPVSITVCAKSLNSSEGQSLVQAWFESQKQE